METVKYFLKEQLPGYLSKLPLPDNVSGFATLTKEEWVYLGPLIATIIVLVLSHVAHLTTSTSVASDASTQRVNSKIELEKEKVVNKCSIRDMEDLMVDKKNVCMCRCWKSKKFPYCDGTHVAHNKQTGDNVGPLILEK